MKIDCLVAEIGSTTTIVNAFSGIDSAPKFLGGGFAPTSVLQGDVNIGLDAALEQLKIKLNTDSIEYKDFFATSSAAGGLRISVHGLVYEMTVKAARESALGAGGIIILTTAGRLTDYDLSDIESECPNLILLSGGTDYGERETALYNAKALCALKNRPPVIYAGNIQNQRQVKQILEEGGFLVYLTENVYPSLDNLNVAPAKKIVAHVFEEHITKAKGMEKVRQKVNESIMPTPGAVMLACELLYSEIGDLVTIDIGGATTDIHSVTCGSESVQRISLWAEPTSKRTVEGDLGVYVNAKNLVSIIGAEELSAQLGFNVNTVLEGYRHIPKTAREFALVERLSYEAGKNALLRHAGVYKHIYGAAGRKTYAAGKDLTAVKHYIGTGGALVKLPNRQKIMESLISIDKSRTVLLPDKPNILYDNDYIMASVGIMSKKYPEAAKTILMRSLGLIV